MAQSHNCSSARRNASSDILIEYTPWHVAEVKTVNNGGSVVESSPSTDTRVHCIANHSRVPAGLSVDIGCPATLIHSDSYSGFNRSGRTASGSRKCGRAGQGSSSSWLSGNAPTTARIDCGTFNRRVIRFGAVAGYLCGDDPRRQLR